MKRYIVFLSIVLALLVWPSLISAQSSGMSVTCNDGTTFSNGIEIVAHQMRVGYNYKATAIGVNGFDPVLAVLDTQNGTGLCDDDSTNAFNYEADLPTTGYIPSASTTAQESFTPHGNGGFEDVSLVVGGYGDQSGEFLLILEGMGVTSTDGAGDAFSIYLTPGMVAAPNSLTVYAITRGQSSVDPLIYLANDDQTLNQMYDKSNNAIYCDDVGDSSACYSPMDMTSSTVTLDSGILTTWDKDAALSLDISGVRLTGDPTQDHLTYVVTSYNHDTQGQYLLAFDISTTDSGLGLGGGSNGGSSGGSTGGNTGGSTSGGDQSQGG